MNTRYLVPLLVAALPLAAAAAPAAAPVIRVNCEKADWPTLEKVAHDVGVSAFDPVAHVRHRAIIAALRACRRGATDVDIVFEQAQHVHTRQPERVAAKP